MRISAGNAERVACKDPGAVLQWVAKITGMGGAILARREH
jgi:hypothetical protein